MRFSAVARSVFLFAAILASACDLPEGADARDKGRVTIPIPRLAGGRQFAAQTGNTDPTGVGKIRLVVRIQSTGQVLLDREFFEGDPDVVINEGEDSGPDAGSINTRFPYPASSADEVFEFLVEVFNEQGVKIFTIGPSTFTLRSDGTSGTVTATPVYVGPNSDVVGVQISPRSISVPAGQQASPQPVCLGVRANGSLTGPNDFFPHEMSTQNPSIAVFDDVSGLRGVSIGATILDCDLEFGTHAHDQITVSVGLGGTPGINLISGGGQSAQVNTALANPVVVEVRNTNGILVPAVGIQASVSQGSVNPTSTTTSSPAGTASFAWTLGGNAGTQTMTITVPSLGLTRQVTATATGAPGSIQVTVRNQSSQLLSGILVELFVGSTPSGQPLSQATTTSTGVVTFNNLQSGVYSIRASNANFQQQVQTANVTPGQTTQVPFTMQAAGSTGSVQSNVTNAQTGSPESGVLVSARSGFGNTTGTVIGSGSTNSGGSLLLSLAPGQYTLTATKSGFANFTTNVTVVVNQLVIVPMPIQPLLSGNQVSINLQWNNTSLDLDSHLFLPNNDIVWWANSSLRQDSGCQTTVFPFACLVKDAIPPFGDSPDENILLGQVVNGVYTFKVMNFTADINGTEGDQTLSNSGARVDVYVGNTSTPTRSFSISPNQSGDLWTVFTMQLSGSVVTFTTVNTVTVYDLCPSQCPLGGGGTGAGMGASLNAQRPFKAPFVIPLKGR